MDQFIAALLAPPALFFSLLLGAALLYWLMVIVGALDLDLFHLGHGGDGHGHGVGDGHGHDGHDGGGGHGPLHGALDLLSVGKVPLTLVATALVLTAWLVCMVGQLTLLPLLAAALPPWLLALVLFAAAVAVALPVTAVAMLPLRQAFAPSDEAGQRGGISLVGQLARVTSRTVDPAFGTAVCTLGGSEIVLNVVTGRPDLVLTKDQQAVIVHYDDERQVHVLGPAPEPALAPAADETPARPAPAPVSEPSFPVADVPPSTTAPAAPPRPRINA